jgi:hypothetical protein
VILLRRLRSGPRCGVVLLWSTFAAMVVFAAAFVLSTLASSSKRVADLDFRRTAAEHLSQGALSFAAEALHRALEGGSVPPGSGTATIGGTRVGWTIERLDGEGRMARPASEGPLVTTWRVEGTAELGGVPAASRQIVKGIVGPVGVQVQNVVAW